MPKPNVSSQVIDLTTRVNSVSTYNSAIVVASKKGPINVPTLVTSQTDLLRRFTADEFIELGEDTAMYEAFQYLSTKSNLYVVRAAHMNDLETLPDDKIPLYGGCNIVLYKSSQSHKAWTQGIASLDDAVIDTANFACVITGANQGVYNDNLAVTIITDPDQVKLDGAFILNVYKKDRNTKKYTLVESWTCSLDPNLIDGFGRNCYIEQVLTGSNYIRAVANDDDNLQDISYGITVVGTATCYDPMLTNKDGNAVTIPTRSTTGKSYAVGDCIQRTDLPQQVGFFQCVVAGKSDKDVTPTFYNDQTNKYLPRVEDLDCVWELVEVQKVHNTETQFEQGDIIKVSVNGTQKHYRVAIAGTTSDTAPTWGADTVEDGTVTWVNVYQKVQTSSRKAFTYKEGIAEQVVDLSTYKAYKDEYLTTQLEMPETASIYDPTKFTTDEQGQIQRVVAIKEVEYSATYTGTATAQHIILPKASELDSNGNPIPTPLAGGDDGSAVLDSDRIAALNMLKNRKTYNVQLILDGANCTPTYQRAIDDVCTVRKQSAHGLIGVPMAEQLGQITGDAQADVVNYRKETLNINSTNMELFVPHQLIYDQFNDRNIYVSPGCFVAQNIMETAQTLGWHWISAGYNRGVVNSLDVAATYDDTVLDTFCDAQINPIIKEAGSGQVIFDEQTLMSKACDLQDAHISRYVNIYLRPALEQALKYFLFEFNDAETRQAIVKMIENFMTVEKSKRAVQSFYVVCDSTNNLPNDIQNNICNCWLFIIPTKGIKFLKQSIIISKQGAQLEDLTF